MSICIFEDQNVDTLLPLAHFQPVFGLRCGIFTPLERAIRFFPEHRICLMVRDTLEEVTRVRHPELPVNELPDDRVLMLSGRFLYTAESVAILKTITDQNRVCTVDGHIAAISATGDAIPLARRIVGTGSIHNSPAPFKTEMLPGIVLSYPWDIISRNGSMIIEDSSHFPLGDPLPVPVPDYVHVRNSDAVSIGVDVTLSPGVVLDATEGPVVIDDRATIMSNAVVTGPAYIGKNTIIKIGARIYGNTSIGPFCKIGGEVEGSIVHSHANKQHDGFLGHSYLSSWTNIGADTNTSDLKNTYGSIRMILEGAEYDTGQMFLGLIMADHAKCGINTMFNTGTSVGVGCNIFGADYLPRYIPSFSWGGASGLAEYPLRKCISVARTVLSRRGMTLHAAEEHLLETVFNRTNDQRSDFRNRRR